MPDFRPGTLSYRSSGNSRAWQGRPPAHALGNRQHIHGKLQPMHEPGFLARLFGRR